MGYRIDNAEGFYTGAWSRWDNPPRPLLEGEVTVECEWDDENNRPIGATMPTPEPTPDWAAFESGVNALSFYAQKVLLAPASNLFPALIHNVEKENTERVGQLIGLMVSAYSFTEQDVAEFQLLLDACNIPITIGG